jgi:uncharacterized membrane protein YidH (DUF202 family)
MAWLRMNLSPAAFGFAYVLLICLLSSLFNFFFSALLYLSHFVSGVTDISGQLTTILAGIRRQKCMYALPAL